MKVVQFVNEFFCEECLDNNRTGRTGEDLRNIWCIDPVCRFYKKIHKKPVLTLEQSE